VVGEYAEIKAKSELTNDVSGQRAKDVLIPLGQGIDTEGHDDLSDKLNKGGLNHLDHHQVVASVDKGGEVRKWKMLQDFLKRTTNGPRSIGHREWEIGRMTYGLNHRQVRQFVAWKSRQIEQVVRKREHHGHTKVNSRTGYQGKIPYLRSWVKLRNRCLLEESPTKMNKWDTRKYVSPARRESKFTLT
jgi:hypothetical protein